MISKRPRDAAIELVHFINISVVFSIEGLARQRRDLIHTIPARDLEPLLVESFIVFP